MLAGEGEAPAEPTGLEPARQLTGLKTKRAIVHEALRALVQIHEQATVRALRGKMKWEGDLHQQRCPSD